ncbi:MAG: DUF3267 domain-containing protein [Clostridium sp.]
MKLVYGEMPSLDRFFEEDSIWKKADMFNCNKVFNCRIKILFIISLIFSFGVGYSLYPYHTQALNALKYFFMYFILSLIVVFPVHYATHIILIPSSIRKGFFVVNLNRLSVKLFINKSISKDRYILSYLMPFIILTIIPFIYVTFINHNLVVFAIAYANALYSVGDLVFSYALIRYIPEKTIIRFYSNQIYYKYSGFTTSIKSEESDNDNNIDSKEKVIEVKKSKLKL